MAGQILQHRAYIGGIEVPIVSVSVGTSENSIWQANIGCPWSPFLTKLPKNTKITVFRRNTDLFSNFRLLFDGVLAGVSESRSWRGQAAMTLHVTSDASILGTRRKEIIPLEFALSQDAVGNKLAGSEGDTVTVTELVNVVPVELSMFADMKLVGNDACKAAAYFLSGTPTDSKPSGKVFHDNTKMVTSGGTPGKAFMSPFMNRFYNTFNFARKICHVPLPQVWINAIANEKAWELLTGQVHNAKGMVSYWELGRYLINWFQGSILSIPDATYIGAAVGTQDKVVVNKPSKNITKIPLPNMDKNALGELIIMPHNYFGNAPLCNIIFPDQIISRSLTINHGAEFTRAGVVGQSIPGNQDNAQSGLTAFGYVAPSGLSGYFTDLNLSLEKPEGKRSPYENEFGISYITVPLPQGMLRLWNNEATTKGSQNKKTAQAPPTATKNTMNHEFMISYSQKYTINVEVTPDVEVVPGSSVILLDEEGEHWFAYCSGVTYSWSIEGQASVQLNLTYAHHHSWNFTGAIHYGNSLSDINPDLVKIYSALVGSQVPLVSNEETAQKYFNLWNNTYHQDSRQMKYFNQKTNIIRDVCTMQEYVTFMGGVWSEVSQYDFTKDTPFTTLGQTIVDKFDCSSAMAKLSTAPYVYYDKFAQKPITATPTKPKFKTIGQAGPLTPSTYISGIVDCHLKWLKNVGHVMSV